MKMVQNDAFTRGKALNLFWEYFHEGVREEKLQEQIVTDLK